ncbi:ATP cone domain-containing protein [Clostridium celatum]|uniref:ATP cone domain-containing protein n=1 Tax=Clostridium celatum TaxID=36834 RepID=UPI00319E5D31
MKIIKKDGRIQDLEVEKIKNSIWGASKDSNTIINESDLKILTNRVIKIVTEIRGRDGITSSYEVQAIIIESLDKDGFKRIANAYLRY